MLHLYHIRALPTDRPIHIFGAGQGGECLLEAFTVENRHRVVGFIDTEKTGTLAGLPVVPTVDFVRTAPRDVCILLATQHWPEVADTLATFGFARLCNAYPIVCRRLGIRDATWMRRMRGTLLATGIASALAASYLVTVLALALVRGGPGSP